MPIQMRVIAYLARGETQANVQALIKKEFGKDLTAMTITNIKKRNIRELDIIKNSIIQQEVISAQKLLEKSRKLIGHHLTKAEEYIVELDALESQYRRGEINLKEYKNDLYALESRFKPPTIGELTAISKEMLSETKAADEPPALPQGNPTHMDELAEALEGSDEIKLQQVTFHRKDKNDQNENSSSPSRKTVQASEE